MPLAHQVITGTGDPATGIFTLSAPPANTLGIEQLGVDGFYRPVPMAALSSGGVGTSTIIARSATLATLRNLLTSQPIGVEPNVLYISEDGAWNGGSGDNYVRLHGLDGEFAPIGYGYVGGVLQVVAVDVVAGTYVPYAGGGPVGSPRDPFAVGDVASITAAVTDASNTWADGDLTAYGTTALRNAGAPPAVANQNSTILVGTADVATMDEFDMKDSTGSAWRYRYSRRNDGTSGWTRVPKG